MPDYLAEADWKTMLNKPKNLGLRAQGTGVSEKLRKYKEANDKFEKNKSEDGAGTALKAVQALKKLADSESKAHKAFADATAYLKLVVTEAGKREAELIKEISVFAAVGIIEEAIKKAKGLLKAVDTPDKFKDMNTGSMLQCVRAIGASFALVPSLKKFGPLTGAFTTDKALQAVTDKNLENKKDAVEKFLEAVESEIDKL